MPKSFDRMKREFQALVFQGIERAHGRGLVGRSTYDGRVIYSEPTYAELKRGEPEYKLQLSCMLFGEPRHFYWRAPTWAAAFRMAIEDVQSWIEDLEHDAEPLAITQTVSHDPAMRAEARYADAPPA